MRRAGIAAALVALWVLLWGDLSVANVLGGVAVATALLAAFPRDGDEEATRYVLKPVGAARLVVWFFVQLARSNVLLTREVVSRKARICTAVVACPLETTSPLLTTIISNVIALTPGTMTVETHHDPPVLFVHVLKLDDLGAVRRSVSELEQLVVGSFRPLGPRPAPSTGEATP